MGSDLLTRPVHHTLSRAVEGNLFTSQAEVQPIVYRLDTQGVPNQEVGVMGLHTDGGHWALSFSPLPQVIYIKEIKAALSLQIGRSPSSGRCSIFHYLVRFPGKFHVSLSSI